MSQKRCKTQSTLFGVEISADKVQPTGAYRVSVTMTATTLESRDVIHV